MTNPQPPRAPQRCRACRKKLTPKNTAFLPNKARNPFCAVCVKAGQQRQLDKMRKREIAHTWAGQVTR